MRGKFDWEKWKSGILLGISLILIMGIFFYNILGGAGRIGSEKNGQSGQEEPAKGDTGDEASEGQVLEVHEGKEGITQREVLRLCSVLAYDKEEQAALPLASGIEKTIARDGYDEAINAAVTRGYIEVEELHPEQELTCGELRSLLVAICTAEKLSYAQLIESLPERLKSVTISDKLYLEEFLHIYEVLLSLQPEAERKAKIVSLYVLGVKDNGVLCDGKGSSYAYGECADYTAVFQQWQENEAETDKTGNERRKAQGNMADYVDATISVLVCQDELLYIRGQEQTDITLPNVWIVEAEEQRIKAYISGWYKEYETKLPLSGELSELVCDLKLSGEQITEVVVKSEVIQGKVLLTTGEQIEIEGYGRLPLDENFRIYKVYDELAMESTNRILVGYSITDFVVVDGKICAALIKERLKADVIRVVLHTTGYASLYHKKVELTADRDFIVIQGETQTNYSAGEVLSFDAKKEYQKNARIIIQPTSEEGKIAISSISRTCGVPAYRGSIELVATAEGLLVINELSLEEYLYAVIPSEMPTSYGAESLKVQAVCARSYAYNQLVASRYREYGAHVDDSVNSQVYNNVAENEASIQAVKETYGIVAAYQGNVVTAYYFSTSCGHTASYEEVWESTKSIAYLSGCMQDETQATPDFSEEEVFREFITTTDAKTYDSKYSWYRWQVTVPAEQIAAAAGLEKLKQLEVTKRGTSGIALEVTLAGTKSGSPEEIEKIVSYQSAIRKLLAPKKQEITKQDGSVTNGMSLLPSAFFVMDEVKKDGKLTAVTLYGGGYGHGTGMSQNGVKAMADLGKDYEEILKHYYRGIELVFLY